MEGWRCSKIALFLSPVGIDTNEVGLVFMFFFLTGDVLYELLQYIKTQRRALVCSPLFNTPFWDADHNLTQSMAEGECCGTVDICIMLDNFWLVFWASICTGGYSGKIHTDLARWFHVQS